MTFHLLRDEPIPEGLRRIAHEQIGMALDEIDDVALPLPKKVHFLRKRCKKMRGLLRLAQPLMGVAFETEDRRFRDVGKLLAAHRDTQVRAKTVESLVGSATETGTGGEALSRETLDESRQLLGTSFEAVPAWPLPLYGFVDIGPGFARTYRKCVDAWTDVCREPKDEYFHRLRKWTKYHWYHIRILERMNKPALRKRRRRLHKLQLVLGNAHDFYLLQTALEETAMPDIPMLDEANTRKQELYRDALEYGEKLFDVSCDELIAHCADWWVDWRR
jgi:hypothetical protein